MPPSFMTQEQFETEKATDQTVLISDLSHQLEEARAEIDSLKAASHEIHLVTIRAEGARDALKDLLSELWEKR